MITADVELPIESFFEFLTLVYPDLPNAEK